jgi:hypothetical protein
MTRFTSHLDNAYRYESTITHTSNRYPSVRYTVRRMSFARRCELAHKVRELSRRLEFLNAADGVADRLEAAVVNSEVCNLYLDWGLVLIEGLELDGVPATPEMLLSCGPEDLCLEIIRAIQTECGLSEEERKNS